MAFTAMKLTCVYIALILEGAKSELFTALVEMDPLLFIHKNVINNIENYLLIEEQRLNIVKTFFKQYRNDHNMMAEDSNFLGNPLNAFILIKRLTLDLELVDHYTNVVRTTFDKGPVEHLPGKEDLEGAGTGLLRLQETYALNITQLSRGVLQGNYSLPMTSSDLFEIGRRAYLNKDLKNAILWLMEALNKFKSRPESEIVNFDEGHIVNWIRKAYEFTDDIRNTLTWTKKYLTLRPDDEKAEKHLIEIENRYLSELLLIDSQQDNNEFSILNEETKPSKHDEELAIFHTLCRGDHELPRSLTKNLHCHYKSGSEPFLKLARIKAEEAYADPEITLFHDVISDKEIKVLKDMARNKLERATVVKPKDGKQETSSQRTTKTAWFDDEQSNVVARLSRRAMDFTGLNVETAESLQIANYGIGGHYEVHYDYFHDNTSFYDRGNRIATVLFYMSDVEQGGATVFPDLGLTVFPMKNSAIFWHNLYPSGQRDQRTKHGACPVLRGIKWVCNKWFRESGQENRRPCNLEFQE